MFNFLPDPRLIAPLRSPEISSIHKHRALRGVVEPLQQSHNGALAAPRFPNEGHFLALTALLLHSLKGASLLNGQADALQHLDLRTCGVGEAHVLQLQAFDRSHFFSIILLSLMLC